jgi:hypothetical protein
MRIPTVCLVLVVSTSVHAAPSVFEGLWFTCIPEMAGRSSPYCLSNVEREGNGLRVLTECGTDYAATGRAVVAASRLVARDANSKIIFSLTESEATRVHRSREMALKKSEPIRTTQDKWQSLAKQCEAIVEESSK